MCQGIQLPFTWPMLWVIRWGLRASGEEIRGDPSPCSWTPAQASLSPCFSLIWIRSYLKKVFSFLSVSVVLKVWPHFGTCSITWEPLEMQILQLHPRPTNALGTKVQQSAWANPPEGSAAHWHLRALIDRHQKKKLPQIQMMCNCSIVPPSWWTLGLIPIFSYKNKKSVSNILSNIHLHGLMLVFL